MAPSALAKLGMAAALTCVSVPAFAAQFKCPKVGGEFVFGQEANVNSLDQMTSSTISTRNLAMNMFETLMTRDENTAPIPELASKVDVSADGMTYTFALRQGVKFHNGKTMTSADVVASYDRYNKVGILRSMFGNVASWEAPDANTFVIRMKKAQPTFILQLSSFSVPPVIVPSENADAAPQQLKTVGTGPWQLTEFTPGSQVKMRRYDGYSANTAYEDRTGFGGYKQACFDSVTFRIVTEPGARLAGMKTGELHGVEDLPTKALADLKNDKNVTLLPLLNWWIQIALPNASFPPTDNLAFRKAVQAALDMDEIMDAASDGNYKLNVGLRYPNNPDYTDAGKETYNQKNAALAKKYLAEAGYKGEAVTLLTNKDYPAMYNSALVMSEQMKAVGINAVLKVVDWPTSVQMALNTNKDWNFFYTGWGTQPALGGLDTVQLLIEPGAAYKPANGDDPELFAAWQDMNNLPSPEGRQAAFARAQKVILEKVYAVPFGSLTKVQATRANVQGFKPFRIPRMSNVWFTN